MSAPRTSSCLSARAKAAASLSARSSAAACFCASACASSRACSSACSSTLLPSGQASGAGVLSKREALLAANSVAAATGIWPCNTARASAVCSEAEEALALGHVVLGAAEGSSLVVRLSVLVAAAHGSEMLRPRVLRSSDELLPKGCAWPPAGAWCPLLRHTPRQGDCGCGGAATARRCCLLSATQLLLLDLPPCPRAGLSVQRLLSGLPARTRNARGHPPPRVR